MNLDISVRQPGSVPASHLDLIGKSAAIVLVLLGVALHGRMLLNHDVAWFLIAAQRMVDGGSYSADFFEFNMPLAIAVYVPPYLLAKFLHLSLEMALSLWVAALSAQSAYLSSRFLTAGAAPVLDKRLGTLFASWLLVGFLFLPGADFGQREQLVAILGLPFLCACANGSTVPFPGRKIRGYAAALAATGFFIKPHYAALPFLLLAYAAWRRKSRAPLVSPEAWILLAVGLANAAWTLLVYPDWFVCARWALDLYGAYHARHWTDLFKPGSVEVAGACLLTQIVAVVSWRSLAETLWPFLLGALYASLAYLAQHKGWGYQALVAELIVFSAQGLALLRLASVPGRNFMSRAEALILGGGAAILLLAAAQAMRAPLPYAMVERIANSLPGARRGDSIYAFSVEVTPVFPAVSELGLKWGSRYSPLWPLLELARVENGFDPADKTRLIGLYRGPLVDSVVEDFERYSPDYVLVDRRYLDVLPRNFDILALFLADQRFARIWRGYGRVGGVMLSRNQLIYEVYRKLPSGPKVQ